MTTGLPIHRRDFLNGVLLAAGPGTATTLATPLATALATPLAATAAAAAEPLPPATLAERTGLQGQTDAAAAAAHAWRDDPQRWQRQASERDEGIEDLVVVGAGLSGLAGAWLFREHAGRAVRVLLLDALDDIGGHARRNEFVSRSGQRLVGYGGSQSLDSPGLFSPAVHQVLAGVGIDLRRFETEYFDRAWARRHGVAGDGLYFDAAAAAGEPRLVVRRAGMAAEDWVAHTPLPAAAQAAWLRLLQGTQDVMPGASAAVKRTRLAAMSYRHFLQRHWQLPPEVLAVYQADTQGYFGVGIEATSALDAWAAGLPGFGGLQLGDALDARLSPSGRQLKASQDDYIYHFPDGNAGVARALLRALIPAALPGDGIERLVATPLQATQLDRADQPVRLRLQATVLGLRHIGPPDSAERVELRYVDGAGTLRTVQARQVLLACWHRVIARLTDELRPAQVAALNDQVKVPLVYGTVLLSNWRAWQNAGLRAIKPVGGFWNEAALDVPVSIGSVRCAQSPDEPILLHLDKVVLAGGGAPRAQAAAGRRLLAGWPFGHFEASIHALLQGALGPHGFEAARDIEAITVNRWSHGYAYEYMRPWDRYWPQGPLPCMTARRGWGRVAIANADAGAYAYAHSAIDQAARAVAELLPVARLPQWNAFPGPDPRTLGLA